MGLRAGRAVVTWGNQCEHELIPIYMSLIDQ